MKVVFFFSILSLAIGCNEVRSQGTWRTESSAGFPHRFGMTSAVVDGKIFVMGGDDDSGYVTNTLEVFDPLTNSWSTPVTTGTFTPRDALTSQVVDGRIFVMGGGDSSGNALNTLEVFDPATNTWSTPVTTGDFTPRGSLTSVVLGGKIYVMCGNDGGTPLNTVEVFDPSTNSWTTPVTTGILTPRFHATSAVVDGKIYVMGGYRNDYLNTIEMFDTVTNSWSRPSTPDTATCTPRSGGTCAVVEGKIFLIGGLGRNGDGYLSKVEKYDPSANSWSTLVTSGTFTPRSGLTCEVAAGNIYVIGGANDSATLSTNEALTFGTGSVAEGDGGLTHSTFSCYPNPATDRATISFDLPEHADVRVDIHDDLGRLVATLANGEMEAGSHQLTWQPDEMAGTYVCTVKSVHLNVVDHYKLVLLR